MDVTDEVACTLRAEAHHPPCIMEAVAVALYENHSQDTRYRGPLDTAPTVNAKYGTGGNNQPFVVGTPKTLKIRSGCEGGGKGALIQEDVSATLSCNNDQTLFVPFCKGTRPHSAEEAQVWKEATVANTLNTFDVGESRCSELAVQAFGIGSAASKGMMSANPHAGIYKADTSKTLDQNGGNPACKQGGIAVVEGAAYSLTMDSCHRVSEEQAPTLMARDYKDPTAVSRGYSVRRLTPTECARLQGFPDWWCAGLETEEPSEADIAFWTEVWKTHRRVVGSSSKPKSRNQITKWLKSPHSDSAEYKMWGNGVALPCVFFVLAGIVWSTQSEGM